jgi:hypothetical protein
MNDLHPRLATGTVGELITQLRLLEHGVQANPPLKDTGNDLLAIKGEVFKAIQVKSTRKRHNHDIKTRFSLKKPSGRYHILAFVIIEGENNRLLIDQTAGYLLRRTDVKTYYSRKQLEPFELSKVVDDLFAK